MKPRCIFNVVSFAMLLLVLSGCKTKYVSVPEYHTMYIHKTDTFAQLDSIYIKDSVFVTQKGDTIITTKVVYRDRYHNVYKVGRDTIIKNDSILVSYPVSRELTGYERRLMDIGKMGIVLMVLLTLAIGFYIIWWYKNKS